MKTKLDDGEVIDVGDLLRVGDAAVICKNSRQSILQWIDGKGRGARERLRVGYAFRTDAKPAGIPVISRPYFEKWLKRTNSAANPLHNNTANIETTISYPADSEQQPAGTDVYSNKDVMEAVMALKAELDSLKTSR